MSELEEIRWPLFRFFVRFLRCPSLQKLNVSEFQGLPEDVGVDVLHVTMSEEALVAVYLPVQKHEVDVVLDATQR